MIKHRLFLKFSMITLIVIGAFTVSACCPAAGVRSNEHEYGIYYELSEDGENYIVSEVGYKETQVVIPETHAGKPVTEIAEDAFVHNIRVRSRSCFADYDYLYVALESLTIPQSVKRMGAYNFSRTDGSTLKKLIYNGTLQDWLKIDMFGSLFSAETELYIDGELIEEAVIPEETTVISANAFSGYKKLKSVVFHEKVALIEDSAFSGCDALKEVSFTAPNVTVGFNAFAYSGIENVTFASGNAVLNSCVFYECKKLKTVEWNGAYIAVIPERSFAYCTKLESFIVPASVEVIRDDAFYEDTNLKTVYNLSKLGIVKGSKDFGGVALYADSVNSSLY